MLPIFFFFLIGGGGVFERIQPKVESVTGGRGRGKVGLHWACLCSENVQIPFFLVLREAGSEKRMWLSERTSDKNGEEFHPRRTSGMSRRGWLTASSKRARALCWSPKMDSNSAYYRKKQIDQNKFFHWNYTWVNINMNSVIKIWRVQNLFFCCTFVNTSYHQKYRVCSIDKLNSKTNSVTFTHVVQFPGLNSRNFS